MEGSQLIPLTQLAPDQIQPTAQAQPEEPLLDDGLSWEEIAVVFLCVCVIAAIAIWYFGQTKPEPITGVYLVSGKKTIYIFEKNATLYIATPVFPAVVLTSDGSSWSAVLDNDLAVLTRGATVNTINVSLPTKNINLVMTKINPVVDQSIIDRAMAPPEPPPSDVVPPNPINEIVTPIKPAPTPPTPLQPAPQQPVPVAPYVPLPIKTLPVPIAPPPPYVAPPTVSNFVTGEYAVEITIVFSPGVSDTSNASFEIFPDPNSDKIFMSWNHSPAKWAKDNGSNYTVDIPGGTATFEKSLLNERLNMTLNFTRGSYVVQTSAVRTSQTVARLTDLITQIPNALMDDDATGHYNFDTDTPIMTQVDLWVFRDVRDPNSIFVVWNGNRPSLATVSGDKLIANIPGGTITMNAKTVDNTNVFIMAGGGYTRKQYAGKLESISPATQIELSSGIMRLR